MIRNYLSILLTLILTTVYGQKQDSIITDIGSLYYKSYGNGEKLILLSGGPGVSSDQLSDLAIRLSDKYNCILFDQRGTGLSKAIPFDSTTINLDNAISDLELLRNKLKEKKLTIIGHSWGAMLALEYAIRNQEKVNSLFLIGPGYIKLSNSHIMADNRFSRTAQTDTKLIKQWNDSIKDNKSIDKANDEIRKIRLQWSLYDRNAADTIFTVVKKGVYSSRMSNLMHESLRKQNWDISEKLKKLKTPIYIICGRQDPVGIFPSFEIKELCPQAKIAWIDKCGHIPWIENEKAFYHAFNSYMRK